MDPHTAEKTVRDVERERVDAPGGGKASEQKHGAATIAEPMRYLARTLSLDHLTAVAADAVALLAFVTVGLLNHHGSVSATGYARDAIPIVGCWLLAGGAFDLYKRPRARALFGTWLLGVTAGVVVRALIRL